jgi:CHAD domain-containing protein
MLAPMRTHSLAAYLSSSAATLGRLVPRFAKRVDPEPVHQARVALRRTQAALWVAHKADARLAFPELAADLKALARALGERRDLDVALEVDAALELLRRRREATARLALLAAPEHWAPVASALAAAVAALTLEGDALDVGAAQAALRKKLGSWLDHPPHPGPEVHELRKSLKRTRYALEALNLDASPLHDVQQELGKMHDAQVLMQLRGVTKQLQKLADKHEKRGLKKAKKALKHARDILKS